MSKFKKKLLKSLILKGKKVSNRDGKIRNTNSYAISKTQT